MPNPRILPYTSLWGIQTEPTGFREMVRDKRKPVLVMDNEENEVVAVLLPHKVAERVERLLAKRTGSMTKHFSGDSFEDDAFAEVLKAFEENGMVRLGNESSGIHWSGLLAAQHLDLVFEVRPDWREAFSWEGLAT